MSDATYHRGLSIFYSNVDRPPLTGEKCEICLAPMIVDRYVTPRSTVQAMGGIKTDSYVYKCPMAELELHGKLTELYLEWDGLKSERLKAIVWEEIEEKRKGLP